MTRPTLKLAVLYVVMLAGAVGLFLAIRAYGEALSTAAPAVGVAPPAHPAASVTFHLLLVLAAVMLLGRLLARLFAFAGQPPVIGEVVAGIALGPSVLGQLFPGGPEWLLPPAVTPYLREIAQLGVILYMFLVGLELNLGRLREKAHAAVLISHASIVVPFVLGSALALVLFADLAPPGVPFTSFALFMGAAMSITAFPVLARILTDRGLTRTELGTLALACAASDDVTAWCLLAGVVGVARAEVQGAVLVVGLTLLFVAFMLLVVRPVVQRLSAALRGDDLSPGVMAGVLVALLLSALATEAIGIHALFGAFLLGAIFPHDSVVARVFVRRFEAPVTILLLPAFFAFTGMRTEINLVAGWDGWRTCGLIILTATAGKFGGTLLAARAAGLGWRGGAALGTLLNTRGLMELIVLNVGLDLGVISPPLFAMMVLMALATTLATSPVLVLLIPDLHKCAEAPAEALLNTGPEPFDSSPLSPVLRGEGSEVRGKSVQGRQNPSPPAPLPGVPGRGGE